MIPPSTKLLSPFQPQETNYQCENHLPSHPLLRQNEVNQCMNPQKNKVTKASPYCQFKHKC